MSITRIRVPSRWIIPSDAVFLEREVNKTAEFVLGVGPCGKTVEALEVHYHTHGVEIVQLCTCTERKVFVYPWHTVTGRVEVTYG